MQQSSTWEKRVSNRTPALIQAIDDLDRCLAEWGADESARYLARLAVEELGTNIIKYGYDDQKEHVICLRADAEGDRIRIWLEDDGHEFNPCLSPEPDPNLSLDERAPGGWGLSLVRRLAAGLEYQRRDGRNLICVEVLRHSPPSP
jgi:anti-sigma regulatory factor (Ser/Thr protein kinase)